MGHSQTGWSETFFAVDQYRSAKTPLVANRENMAYRLRVLLTPTLKLWVFADPSLMKARQKPLESSRGGNFAQVITDSYLSQQLSCGVFFSVVVNRKDMFSIVEPRYRPTQLIYRVIHLPLHIDNPRFYARRIDNPRFYARRRNNFSQ